MGCALLYGQLRLVNTAPGETIRVGAVVSPVTHKEFRGAVDDVDTLRALDNELFARSKRAVDLGARAVVWNEVATLVSVAGESALVSRGQAFSREPGFDRCGSFAAWRLTVLLAPLTLTWMQAVGQRKEQLPRRSQTSPGLCRGSFNCEGQRSSLMNSMR